MNNNEFEHQLAVFSTIPWTLAAASESLYVSHDSLTEEQQRVLNALAQKKLMEEPYSKIYDFYPPKELNPEKAALWDTAFPAAEKRLMAALEPLVDLPWQHDGSDSNEYFVWASNLASAQKSLIGQAPQGAVKDERNGSLFTGFRKDDRLYKVTSEGRGYTHNRLHGLVHERIEGGIRRDEAVIADLPWQFDQHGNLVLDDVAGKAGADFSRAAKQLPASTPDGREPAVAAIEPYAGASQAQEVLSRRGVRTEGGKYVLGLPNTVGEIYKAADGDTDRARNHLYQKAHDAALGRNKPLMQLRWRFDRERWTFVVDDAELTASRLKSNVEGALTRQGPVHEVHDLRDFTWRASGPRAQVEELRAQLAEAVPHDLDISDLASLPWKYTHDGLSVPMEDFARSQFARKKHARIKSEEVLVKPPGSTALMRLGIGYPDKVIIGKEDIRQLPYFTAVRRGLEARFEQFVSEHADEIRALPWSFRLRDDIKSYGVARLHAEDLIEAQRRLVDQLVAQNQMENHSKQNFFILSERMFALVQPQFEQWKPLAVKAVADLPWEHHYPAVKLVLSPDLLTAAQQKGLERLGFGEGDHGGYSIGSKHEGPGFHSPGDEILNDLRRAIGEQMRERTPAAQVTDEIMALPWQYEGRTYNKTSGRNIVLDCSRLTDAQEARVKAEIPGIHYMKDIQLFDDDTCGNGKGKKGFFDFVGPDDDHAIARAATDKPYHAALQPTADRNLELLVQEVAAFGWKKNGQGAYEITQRDMTREQQIKLRQVPEDYFDGATERAQRSMFSENRAYIADPAARDQKLMQAIRSRHAALPGPAAAARVKMSPAP